MPQVLKILHILFAANDASQGCIIMPRSVRDALNNGDSLEVVR